jgi:acyl CoA:acetate/3-ketoacid CoA transferase beta subunit
MFDVDHEKDLALRKCNPLTSIGEIRKKTAAVFEVGNNCTTWKI